MQEVELKPCPFCGGQAIFKTISNMADHSNIGFDFGIKCRDCGMTFPKIYVMRLDLDSDGTVVMIDDEREIAVKQWNDRKEDSDAGSI